MKNVNVTVTHEPQFIRFTTTGNYAFNELFGFLESIKAEAERTATYTVLIDSRRLAGPMTEAERFAGGQKIAELFGSKIKAALIMPEWNITKLGELAAVNRGAKFLVTHSEEEALGFLRN